MKYWIISPHNADDRKEFDNAWKYDLNNNTIAIGWYELGDPRKYQDKEELIKKLKEIFPKESKRFNAITDEIWDFYYTIKPGAIIIARRGVRKIIGIGTVKPNSNAYYDKEKGIKRTGNNKKYSPNFRDVEWKKIDLELDHQLSRFTLTEIEKKDYDFIVSKIFSYKKNKTRVDEIIEALDYFGGIAHYKDLEKYVRENTKKEIPDSLIHNIRGELERKSSDSERYDETEDLFYAVGGKGDGIWGLREIDKEIDKDTFEELRKIAYEDAKDFIKASISTNEYRKRSTRIKAYALMRANGICEGCNSKAPFVNKEGKPFLEVHHITRLADDGPDDPRQVIALCPNCHRKAHYSKDNDQFNERLSIYVNKKENEF